MISNSHLMHEHYFVVDKRVKEVGHFVVRCNTCGRCYCEICGIILGAFTDSSVHDSESRYDNRVLDSKKINKDIEI